MRALMLAAALLVAGTAEANAFAIMGAGTLSFGTWTANRRSWGVGRLSRPDLSFVECGRVAALLNILKFLVGMVLVGALCVEANAQEKYPPTKSYPDQWHHAVGSPDVEQWQASAACSRGRPLMQQAATINRALGDAELAALWTELPGYFECMSVLGWRLKP
jgi:hypothetical protein